MPIANAIQRGRVVYVYDERNRTFFTRAVHSDGELLGYTSTTVNIRNGRIIYTYDERGRTLATRAV
ncbi:MAG: hypothetical protein E1N59_2978 [Puniceicoccaceae bacterium 5H]|nr:MAG: hypothetical protein E1N59_2978 [Puniceicoccaceae bacterium 5H]